MYHNALSFCLYLFKTYIMKKLLLLLFLGFTLVGFSQTTLIPDPNFEQALIDLGYDTAPINGSVLTANISSVTNLNVEEYGITDLTGIEDFTDLNDLRCGVNEIMSLDVSNNNALEVLWCSGNQLTSLDLSNNTALLYLNFSYNQLTSLDVSNNSALIIFYCRFNQLTSLDLTNNIDLARSRSSTARPSGRSSQIQGLPPPRGRPPGSFGRRCWSWEGTVGLARHHLDR